MNNRIIPAAWKPVVDQYHFAPAVRHGDILHMSGMIGIDLSTLSMVVEPEAQFRAVFENLRDVLAEAGATLADIIEMKSFHVDMEHLELFCKVKDEYIKEPYPAWSSFGITELSAPEALVEVCVVAKAS